MDMASISAKVLAAIGSILVLCLWSVAPAWAHSPDLPFAPGEKLYYQLRWENIPAGEALLEVQRIQKIGGSPAYHFVMIAKSNAFVDIFYKIRDRVDAYADTRMTRSVYYKNKQSEGDHKRDEVIEFDWVKNQASYANAGVQNAAIDLLPGSFDPLSAFYYTRMTLADPHQTLERPVTDGKKNVIGRARIVKRETITLKNGKTFDTFCIEPEIKHIGGVFKKSKNAKIRIWVTADDKRIPVQIKSKVAIGHFIGELVSAEGVH